MKHGKFREYPPGLLPRKQYIVGVVDAALSSRVEKQPVEDFCSEWGMPEPSTPGAWIRQFEERLTAVEGKTHRLLETLEPGFDPTATKCDWMYKRVWELLTRLRDACQRRQMPFHSRAYQALFA